MLVNEFLTIFEQTCITMIPWVPGVIGVWMVFDLISGLFHSKDK